MNPHDFYDRQGQLISFERMRELSQSDAYCVVAQEVTATGWFVSTVWLRGLDHAFGVGPPILFETMVFVPGKVGREYDCARYSTEEEAVAGHKEMVVKWSDTLRDVKTRLGLDVK